MYPITVLVKVPIVKGYGCHIHITLVDLLLINIYINQEKGDYYFLKWNTKD